MQTQHFCHHGDTCESGKMAILVNSSSFLFNISLLHKYRLKYYDYIVKWCIGTACDWYASLDIAYMLALTPTLGKKCALTKANT